MIKIDPSKKKAVHDHEGEAKRVAAEIAAAPDREGKVLAAISGCVRAAWVDLRNAVCADPTKPVRSDFAKLKKEEPQLALAVAKLLPGVMKGEGGSEYLNYLAHGLAILAVSAPDDRGVGIGGSPDAAKPADQPKRRWVLADQSDGTVDLVEVGP